MTGPLNWRNWKAVSDALAAQGIFYAMSAGVTGINDGTRDDAPLIRDAYAAAVLGGYKALLLPIGKIYVNQRIHDAVYPFDYVLKVTVNDFTIIFPSGSLIIDQNPLDPYGNNSLDIFQFTGTRSGITGGGRFTHAQPDNNVTCAVHLTNPAQDCFIDNLSAYGLHNQGSGCFDDSSDHGGSMGNLYIEHCANGVSQQNSGTAGAHSRCTLYGKIIVRDYTDAAIQLSGEDLTFDTLIADNYGFAGSSNAQGVLFLGKIKSQKGSTILVRGNPGNTLGIGINIIPDTAVDGAHIAISHITVENHPIGLNNDSSQMSAGAITETITTLTTLGVTNPTVTTGARITTTITKSVNGTGT